MSNQVYSNNKSKYHQTAYFEIDADQSIENAPIFPVTVELQERFNGITGLQFNESDDHVFVMYEDMTLLVDYKIVWTNSGPNTQRDVHIEWLNGNYGQLSINSPAAGSSVMSNTVVIDTKVAEYISGPPPSGFRLKVSQISGGPINVLQGGTRVTITRIA